MPQYPRVEITQAFWRTLRICKLTPTEQSQIAGFPHLSQFSTVFNNPFYASPLVIERLERLAKYLEFPIAEITVPAPGFDERAPARGWVRR